MKVLVPCFVAPLVKQTKNYSQHEAGERFDPTPVWEVKQLWVGGQAAPASVSICFISAGDTEASSKAWAASASAARTRNRTPAAAVRLGYIPPQSSALIQHSIS
jgi:hypothetical protein